MHLSADMNTMEIHHIGIIAYSLVDVSVESCRPSLTHIVFSLYCVRSAHIMRADSHSAANDRVREDAHYVFEHDHVVPSVFWVILINGLAMTGHIWWDVVKGRMAIRDRRIVMS